MRSAPGTSSATPGPFSSITRPSRNTTPRSYSRSTRTEAPASTAAATATTTSTISDDLDHQCSSHSSARRTPSVSPLTRSTTTASPASRSVVLLDQAAARAPERPVDEHLAAFAGPAAHHAGAPAERLAAGRHLPPARRQRLAGRHGQPGSGDRHGGDHRRHHERHAAARAGDRERGTAREGRCRRTPRARRRTRELRPPAGRPRPARKPGRLPSSRSAPDGTPPRVRPGVFGASR